MIKKLKSKDKVLLQNTIMLYILQFSTYLFSFITVPYQTRILGPQIYGAVGVALAVMAYFQLFLDFGFLLSATEDISKNRNDRMYISKRLSSVAVIKALFSVFSFGIVLMLSFIAKPFSEYKTMYLLYILAYIANSFLPDYFFRGIENMSAVTIRTVAVKAFSCVMTFVFLRDANDYLVVPTLLLIGNVIAVIWAYFYIYKTLKYPLSSVTKSDVWNDLKRSAMFFLSRIATTVYNATNTIILGYVDKTGITTGYYTSADKIVTTAKSGISPISDSIYPYMIKNKNFGLIKKIMLFIEPIIIVGCIVVGIFAKPLCIFAFGKDFAGTAPILQAFLPTVVAILPSYIFGFPTLGAMGLAKYANHSIFFGTIIHIIGLFVLIITGSLSAVTLAIMTSISEWSIMLFRVIAVYINRNQFKENKV